MDLKQEQEDIMTASIVNIISIAALSVMASRYLFPPVISFITGKTTYTRELVKPFECGFCLSWWVGLIIFTIQFGWMGFAYAALCAFCGAIIDRYA